MLMGLLAAAIVGGALAGFATRPFLPTSRIAPFRHALTGLTLVAGAMLLFSLTQDWWLTTQEGDSHVAVTEGTSPFPLLVVADGVLSTVLTVAALHGRRNWAPMSLGLSGLLLGAAWLTSAPDLWDATGELGGQAEAGLRVATWATLLLAVASTTGALIRRAEHRWQPSSSAAGGPSQRAGGC